MRFLFVSLFFLVSNLSAQVDFQKHTIDDLVAARSATSIDLDGDLDTDVVAVSSILGSIFWYDNLDGLGGFSSRITIDNTIPGVSKVISADVDNDGDVDLIASSDAGQRLVWYENLDGQATFGSAITIREGSIHSDAFVAADLDNDTDVDLLSIYRDEGQLIWYENLDGLGSFGVAQIITSSLIRPSQVEAIDMDNDGDLDALVNNHVNWDPVGTAGYFKNDGLGNFEPTYSLAAINDNVDIYAPVDINGDGLIDIAIGDYTIDEWYLWWKCLPNFTYTLGGLVTNFGDFFDPEFKDQFFADMDEDGDMDFVLGAKANLIWYEHLDGQGSFGEKNVIGWMGEIESVEEVDFNLDGAPDILASASVSGEVVWYESVDILNADNNSVQNNVILYPNPTTGIVNILSIYNHIESIEIFNVTGKKLLVQSNDRSINLNKYQDGLYFVSLRLDDGTVIINKILKHN